MSRSTSLAAAPASGCGAATSVPPSHPSPDQLRDQLARYLADDDGEAVAYLAEHTSALQQALGDGAKFATLEKAIQNFDFRAAAAVLASS